MRDPRAVHDAACLAALIFLLAYVAPLHLDLPLPRYLPLERAWTFGEAPGRMAMDWFGRTAFASLAGVVAFGMARLGLRLPVAPRSMAFALALLFCASLALYVEALIDRVPS